MKLCDFNYPRLRKLTRLATAVFGPCYVSVNIYKRFAGRGCVLIRVFSDSQWSVCNSAAVAFDFDFRMPAWLKVVHDFCCEIMYQFFLSVEQNLDEMEID